MPTITGRNDRPGQQCYWCKEFGIDKCPFHEVDFAMKKMRKALRENAKDGPGFYVVDSVLGKLWQTSEPTETMQRYADADVKAMAGMYPGGRRNVVGIDPGHPGSMVVAGIDISDPKNPQILLHDNPYVYSEGEAKMDRLDVVDAEIRRLQKERAILARFPKDNFEDGTVIKFTRVFGAAWEELEDVDTVTRYTYVAIKEGRRWYCTGGSQSTPQGVIWNSLTEWLGDGVGEMTLMTDGRSLLDGYGAEPAEPKAEIEAAVVDETTEATKE